MAPPDIQHLFDMLDAACFFCQPQNQLMVLRTVKFRVFRRACLLQQRPGKHRQMGDVVAPAQIIRRKIRLEVVAAQLFQILRQHDFVTVHKVRAGVLDGLHTFKQGVGIQYVIVVQQRQVLPGGQRKARRGVGGDAAVLDFPVQHPAVLLRGGAGQLRRGGVRLIGGVHQNQLPAAVGLLLHALQHFPEKLRRCVENRHHNAHRRPRQVGGALGLQFPAQRQIRPVLPAVMVQRQPHPERDVPPKLLGALVPQRGGAASGQIRQMRRIQQPPGHAAHTVLHRHIGGAVLVPGVGLVHALLSLFRLHGIFLS